MSVDMFLKLAGIQGEAKDHAHANEIHIESMSWGLSQTGNFNVGGGGGAGKVNVHDISISKYLDKSSPALMMHCSNGKHIADGLITVRKAGGEKEVEYLKIKLKDILVSGIQHAGSSGGDLLTENLTLNFAQYQLEYQEQEEDGTPKGAPVTMGWNIKKNEKV